MNPITLIENVFAATVDKSRREIADARVVIEGGRIAAVLTAGGKQPVAGAAGRRTCGR